MSVDLPVTAKLQHALADGAGTVTLTIDTTELCACLLEPSHMFATIYTATRSERVLVTACDGADLVITRGVAGTESQDWPAGACVCIDTVVEGAVCSDADAPHSQCSVPLCNAFGEPIDLFIEDCAVPDAVLSDSAIGKGLRVDRTDPASPTLQLAPTGVTPGTYGGAVVNECGQLVSIPLGWPSSSLADFNPCCDEGSGTPGTVLATEVSYTASVGSVVVTANNVGAALQQVEDYLATLTLPDSGVTAITAGTGIVVGGTAAVPVVGLADTGIAAGTYDGFTVNAQGQITSYAPPAVSSVSVDGTAPIVVTQAGTVYTVSITPATKTEFGTAKLTDEALLGGSENLIPGASVVTWDFLQLWATLNDQIAVVTAGHDAVVVTFNGVDTYTVSVAPDLIDGTDPITVTLTPATGKFTIEVLDAGVGQKGVVQLADTANAGAPASNDPDDVVTSAYLEAWKVANGL